MHIGHGTSALSSLYSTSTATGGANRSPPLRPDDGGDDNDGAPPPGGPMMDAVAQALQGMGLSMPPPPPRGNDASSSTASRSDDSATDSSSSSADAIGTDLRTFMHDLFEAIKDDASTASGASSSSPSSTATGSDAATGFGAALSSLISQVTGGSTPSDLRDSFAKLVADLQAAGGSGSRNSIDVSGDAGTAPATGAPTLQAFLTNLQQDVGYGAGTRSGSVGSLLSSTA